MSYCILLVQVIQRVESLTIFFAAGMTEDLCNAWPNIEVTIGTMVVAAQPHICSF